MADIPVKNSLDDKLAGIRASGGTPRLLLHCCCAPCAVYVLEYLSPFFEITVLFYNPNIRPREEYDKRAAELQKLPIAKYPNKVDVFVTEYEPTVFDISTTRLEDEPEGGLRCAVCFRLRLTETARRAREDGYEYFTTTLSVSPYKNAALLNEIGGELAGEYGVGYLTSDFKKRDGYKRSIELSNQFGLYRQSYCGCKPR